MIKNKINKIIPPYAWITIALYFFITFFSFYFSRLINSNFHHFNITTLIDTKIPFIPCFILIYILAFVQWFIGYFFVCRESENVCYEVMASVFLAKSLCFLIFITFPTTMTRGDIQDNSIFSYLTNLIYSVDTPDNLLPSLHCVDSWILFRTAHKLKKPGKWLKPAWFVFAVLVFLSVLFVKQHVILDIPAAIIVCEISIYLSHKFNVGRIYKKINDKILKKGNEQFE